MTNDAPLLEQPSTNAENIGRHTLIEQFTDGNSAISEKPLISFEPELLRSKIQTINSLVNSAYVQEQSKGSSALAEEDYVAAVRAADSLSPEWVKDQSNAAERALEQTNAARQKLLADFRADVDALPAPTRRQVNEALFNSWNASSKEGVKAWDNADLVQKTTSAMPPELREKFMQFEPIDRQELEIRQLQQALPDLLNAPLKTRLLLARHYAAQDNIDGSREVLNDMLKVDPTLARSNSFYAAFADPKILPALRWFGAGGEDPLAGIQLFELPRSNFELGVPRKNYDL